MEYYVNYGDRQIYFTIPSGWTVITEGDRPSPPGTGDDKKEIGRALDHPFGSPRIEELAKPGMEVVLLFDDPQRPTPAHLAIPEMMDRLNRAGVPDERVTAICACGTHPVVSPEQLKAKVGDEAASRLSDRLFSHDAKSPDNVIIGRTHRGTLVEVNGRVAMADLIMGVGECMPHPSAGYGGGYKILMPGVSSWRAVAEHHFALIRNRNCTVNLLDGNPWWEEVVDAGRFSRLAFKLDLVMNEKKQVIKAFAGHPEAEQREAARFAESLYLVRMPHRADITITVAAQKQAGPIMPLIKEMGSPQSAGEVHRDFVDGIIKDHLKPFGISFIMQIVHFKDFAERFRIVHVTEGLTPEQVAMMGMEYADDLQRAVDRLAERIPKADVAIFPSGGNVIPHVG
ncbi:MAG: lactate racemase domain-containing protein [Syntrophorhabdales bacterium]